MTEFGGEGFREFADELRKLAEEFDERTAGRFNNAGRDPQANEFISTEDQTVKDAISQGMTDAVQGGIVPDAQTNAKLYVPDEDAETIQHERVNWNHHRLGATSDLVAYHEFGTSTKATDQSKATRNAPDGSGYIIPIEGYDSLPVTSDDMPGALSQIDFEYVVHPGVKAQHFIEKSLKTNTFLIEESVADRLDDLEIDI